MIFGLLVALVAWRLSLHMPPQTKHVCPEKRVESSLVDRQTLLADFQASDPFTIDAGFFPSRSVFASNCSGSQGNQISLFYRVWKNPETSVPK